MMKKVIATMLALVMALTVAGCGSSTTASTTTAATTTESSTEATTETATESEEVTTAAGSRICIISGTGIDDGSFNQDCYEGIVSFMADHDGYTVNDMEEAAYNELVPTVGRVIGDYDIFVLPSYSFMTVGTIAQNNPDKYFIVVDTTITDEEGNAVSLDNVYTMVFEEAEGGFFAGIAAALSTETDKVAVVNAMPYPSNVNYQFGFESGVNYSNEHFGTTAQCVEIPSYAGIDFSGNDVGGNYIGDFTDEANGKVVGEALIAQGVDVIFVAAGAAGNGTFTAIKEAEGVYAIGCDVDQYDDGANGDSNIMLTSCLKVMHINVERQLEAIDEGTFVGADALLGASTDSTGIVTEEGRHQLSDEAVEILLAAHELVKDGTIVPASSTNGYLPEDFPGLS